jgi:hypothetical protein
MEPDNKRKQISDDTCNNTNIEYEKKDLQDKKRKKCSFRDCSKKLTITDMPCRCNATYCILHRHPNSHQCTFNYKDFDRKNLKNTIIGCNNCKIQPI